MRAPLALVFLAAVSAIARADETLNLTFYLGEAEVGNEEWTLRDDGEFVSKSDIDLLGRKVSSEVAGRLDHMRLRTYTQKVVQGTSEVSISFDGATLKVKQDGKDAPDRKVALKTGAAFANIHTQFVRTVFAALDPKKGKRQEVETYMIDAASHVKMTVTELPVRHFKLKEKTETIRMYRVEITMVAIDYAVNEAGQVVGMDVPAQMFRAIADGYDGVFVEPTSRFPELSQPTMKAKAERGVKAQMRDRVELVADIVRPDAEGKFPVILARTPYGRAASAIEAEWWAKRGYVFMVQDCRGRGDSGGDWLPFENETKDGYDTIAWIAKQPWCDGNVGMIGASYGGLVQWQAAVAKPPALKCIVPQVSPPSAFFNIPWDHGLFFLWGNVWWAGVVREKTMSFSGFGVPNVEKLTTLPLTKVDDAVWGKNIPFFDSWLRRDKPSQYPGFGYTEKIASLRIPTLMITGWWDGDLIGTQLNWLQARRGGNPNRWFIAGPWTHMFNASSRLGDVDYGASAVLDLDIHYLRFFDTFLKRKKASIEKTPRAMVFVTGANEWRSLDDWPSSNSKEMSLYFSAPTKANGGLGGGKLVAKPPRSQNPSKYTYDPANAKVPKELAKVDPNEASLTVPISDLKDELVFKSERLERDLTITGPIRVDLHFSTSAKDTDFFARLYELDSKGILRAVNQPGKIGAKYIRGFDTPKLLSRGRVYMATIELWDVAHRFARGSKIVLQVGSNLFPLYARNPGTGESLATATRLVPQKQTVYHDARRPSRLRFRVLP